MVEQIRRALVTGASSGLGAHFARHLADRGVEVVLVARRGDRLRQLADDLTTASEIVVADLADPDDLALVGERLARRDAPVDLLVNNAGFGAFGGAGELGGGVQAGIVEVNVLAMVRLTTAVLPQLLERGVGGVINVGSLAGELPTPGATVYGASKAFVRSYSQGLVDELRGTGVHAMLLAPGVTHTEFGEVAGTRGDRLPGVLRSDAEDVVRQALAAFARRRSQCMPGVHNRAARHAVRLVPTPVTRRISGYVHGQLGRA